MYGAIYAEGEASGSEFITANFGGALPFDDSNLAVVLADPLDACQPLVNDQAVASAAAGGALVVVMAVRGNCRFDVKALYAQQAGAKVLVVADAADNALQRIGMLKYEKHSNTHIHTHTHIYTYTHTLIYTHTYTHLT